MNHIPRPILFLLLALSSTSLVFALPVHSAGPQALGHSRTAVEDRISISEDPNQTIVLEEREFGMTKLFTKAQKAEEPAIQCFGPPSSCSPTQMVKIREAVNRIYKRERPHYEQRKSGGLCLNAAVQNGPNDRPGVYTVRFHNGDMKGEASCYSGAINIG